MYVHIYLIIFFTFICAYKIRKYVRVFVCLQIYVRILGENLRAAKLSMFLYELVLAPGFDKKDNNL